MTDILNHPKCPCDECWCIDCIGKSNKIRSEVESRKQKFIDLENDRQMIREMRAKQDRIRPIADGIRKKHRIVYRFKKVDISRGLDGYDSPYVESFYYGVFSSYENVEKFIGSQKIKDDVVVVKSDKLSDEEIVELDKCLNQTTQEHYGC